MPDDEVKKEAPKPAKAEKSEKVAEKSGKPTLVELNASARKIRSAIVKAAAKEKV